MVKVLLIVPRYELSTDINYNYWFPYGLGFISAVLKKEGYFVDCLNLNHHKGLTRDIINAKLDSEKFDYAMTGNKTLGYPITEVIVQTCKQHKTNPTVVIGGTIVTTEPTIIFNDIKPDFGVIGEGERTIVELLDAIENKKSLHEVKGIIYKDHNNHVVITPKREYIDDLDSLPLPDFEGMGFEEQLENSKNTFAYHMNIFDNPREYPLLASRSCPFQCTFCYHEEKYRKRSMDNIMAEIVENVKKYRINIITIYDECFSFDKGRLAEFCARIKQLQSEITWELKWNCQLIINTVDLPTLQMMKDAGCYMVCYGFESYSPIVLKSMRKFITPEKINKALEETFEAKLALRANFIFGDIAETTETANETLEYWKNSCKGQVNMTFIQPYPGSYIFDYCIKKGLIKDKVAFIRNVGNIGSKPAINMTTGMTDDEINALDHKMNMYISKYCYFIKPSYKKKTSENTYMFKAKCPHCKHVNTYKNFYIIKPWYYGGEVICRNCYMTFFMVSAVHHFGYKNYHRIKKAFNTYKEIVRNIKKKMT